MNNLWQLLSFELHSQGVINFRFKSKIRQEENLSLLENVIQNLKATRYYSLMKNLKYLFAFSIMHTYSLNVGNCHV